MCSDGYENVKDFEVGVCTEIIKKIQYFENKTFFLQVKKFLHYML